MTLKKATKKKSQKKKKSLMINRISDEIASAPSSARR
jgi:hypothetical protein